MCISHPRHQQSQHANTAEFETTQRHSTDKCGRADTFEAKIPKSGARRHGVHRHPGRRLQAPGSTLNELECLMATRRLPQWTFLTHSTKERPKAGLVNHGLPHNSANPTPCCSSPSNKPLSAFRSARTPCTAWFARAAFQRSGSAAAGGYPKRRCLNGPEPRCNNPPARRH